MTYQKDKKAYQFLNYYNFGKTGAVANDFKFQSIIESIFQTIIHAIIIKRSILDILKMLCLTSFKIANDLNAIKSLDRVGLA